MTTSNPIFRNFAAPEVLVGLKAASTEEMTLPGILSRTSILLVLFTASAACSWIGIGSLQNLGKNAALVLALVVLFCTFAGMGLVWITVFMKTWAPITAPVYALMQGAVVGCLTAGIDQRYPGVAIQAVGLTVAICFFLVIAYRSGLIRVTESFNKKLAVATGGVAVYYLITFALAFAGGRTLSKVAGGIPGILVSLIIVVIAGMNLVSNFDYAAQCAKSSFPKYMEWYAALGLLVTLVWLYIETLNLLSKARKSGG